jgi:hypothetical protein
MSGLLNDRLLYVKTDTIDVKTFCTRKAVAHSPSWLNGLIIIIIIIIIIILIIIIIIIIVISCPVR